MKAKGNPAKTRPSKQEENRGKSLHQTSDEFQNGEAQNPFKSELIHGGSHDRMEVGLDDGFILRPSWCSAWTVNSDSPLERSIATMPTEISGSTL